MSDQRTGKGFGLIIIGSEILDGRVRDRHFENTRRILDSYNRRLRYSMILADDPDLIYKKLKWAMSGPEPFFSFGGIGSTPDDFTRKCAADAAGVDLEFHEEGLRILMERFGPQMNLSRKKLVEFPKGAALIPNPVNQIPGFTVSNGHFMPGFPDMAQPMTEWVIQTYYGPGEARAGRTLVVPGAREADLVPMMEDFIEIHPELVFSSLPRFVEGGTEIQLGIQGSPEDVEKGYRDLVRRLEELGRIWMEKTA